MARVAALVSPRVTLEAVDIASQLHETILKKTKDYRNLYNMYVRAWTYGSVTPVLPIRDVYPGSHTWIFSYRIRICNSELTKNLIIFNPKTVTKLKYDPRCLFPDNGSRFFPSRIWIRIPDPRVRKALDPGSATQCDTIMTDNRPCEDFDDFVSQRDLKTLKATFAIKLT